MKGSNISDTILSPVNFFRRHKEKNIYLPYGILVCKTVELVCKSSSAKGCHYRWSGPMISLYPHSLTLFCVLQFFNIFSGNFFWILNVFSSNIWANIFGWGIKFNNNVFIYFRVWYTNYWLEWSNNISMKYGKLCIKITNQTLFVF